MSTRQKSILTIVSLFSCICMFGESTEEIMFFTPVIYRHVFQLAAKDSELRGTLNSPLLDKNRTHSLSGQIIFSDLPLSTEMKEKFDDAFSLSFSLVPEISYKLYIKDDCIMRLEENDSDGRQAVYIRKTGLDKLLNRPEDYVVLSLNTFMEICAKEDMLPALKREKKLKFVDFKITGYSEVENKPSIAVINFPEFSIRRTLTFKDIKVIGTGIHRLRGNGSQVLFALTVTPEYIKASACDESDTGYACHCFPNGYLRDYAPLQLGVWGKLTVWNKQGVQVRSCKYYPEQNNDIPREYHPHKWGIDDISMVSGYSIGKAYYWDDASSPCYKGTLDTETNGKFIFESYFAERIDMIEPLYEKLRKELLLDGKKEETTEVSSIKFKDVAIGEKSLGLVNKDGNLYKLIFQRGIMIFKLENQHGKDVKELAIEVDKCWQKAGK